MHRDQPSLALVVDNNCSADKATPRSSANCKMRKRCRRGMPRLGHLPTVPGFTFNSTASTSSPRTSRVTVSSPAKAAITSDGVVYFMAGIMGTFCTHVNCFLYTAHPSREVVLPPMFTSAKLLGTEIVATGQNNAPTDKVEWNELFIKRLEFLLNEMGWTPSQLGTAMYPGAAKRDDQPKAVTHWFRENRRSAPAGGLALAARTIGVSISYIMGETDDLESCVKEGGLFAFYRLQKQHDELQQKIESEAKPRKKTG